MPGNPNNLYWKKQQIPIPGFTNKSLKCLPPDGSCSLPITVSKSAEEDCPGAVMPLKMSFPT